MSWTFMISIEIDLSVIIIIIIIIIIFILFYFFTNPSSTENCCCNDKNKQPFSQIHNSFWEDIHIWHV